MSVNWEDPYTAHILSATVVTHRDSTVMGNSSPPLSFQEEVVLEKGGGGARGT